MPPEGSHARAKGRGDAMTSKTCVEGSVAPEGFYSQSDEGIFTHMGSKTHIHCVLYDPLASGHVDHVTVPVGTTIKFPAMGDAWGSAGH